MDDLFSSLAMQTVKLVGKAAFGAASSIAMKRVTEYMKSLPDHLTAKAPELDRLRSQFASKLRIVTPAIDLIEIIAARGHSTMASVLQLTHSLRRDIVKFTEKLETLERQEKTLGKGKLSVEVSEGVTKDLKSLLAKIEEAVPLLNLALTTSGAHLGGAMPQGVSPGRLMQASVLVARADERFEAAKEGVLVGEPLVLRLYSLFVGSVRPKSKNDFTWKEEYAKCQAELWRVPPSSSSADTDGGHGEPMGALQYELRIIEDLDDGRYHDEESAHDGKKVAPAAIGMLKNPGRVVRMPLASIANMHYTSAGSLLNIEDSNSPVLVLHFQTGASPKDYATTDDEDNVDDADTQAIRESQIDKWYALEVLDDDDDDDNESDGSSDSESDSDGSGEPASTSEKIDALGHALESSCSIGANTAANSSADVNNASGSAPSLPELARPVQFLANEWRKCILSLLEYMVRLAAVEMSEQMSHLEVPDEKLRLYLTDAPVESNVAMRIPGAQSLTDTPQLRSRSSLVSSMQQSAIGSPRRA